MGEHVGCLYPPAVAGAYAMPLRVLRFQMVAQTPDGFNADVGTNTGELPAQNTDVDLHMIFHRVRIIPPYAGQNGFLGKVLFPGSVIPTLWMPLIAVMWCTTTT